MISGNDQPKAQLRQGLQAARVGRLSDSRVLSHQLHSVPEIASAAQIAAYMPRRGEPDIADFLAQFNRTVWLPVVRGELMHWGTGAVAEGFRGIREPEVREVSLPTDVHVVIVPALACDVRGHRLGTGGGFYDRTFATDRGRVFVAVIHDDELLDEVPVDAHDVTMNIVVTPQRIIRI